MADELDPRQQFLDSLEGPDADVTPLAYRPSSYAPRDILGDRTLASDIRDNLATRASHQDIAQRQAGDYRRAQNAIDVIGDGSGQAPLPRSTLTPEQEAVLAKSQEAVPQSMFGTAIPRSIPEDLHNVHKLLTGEIPFRNEVGDWNQEVAAIPNLVGWSALGGGAAAKEGLAAKETAYANSKEGGFGSWLSNLLGRGKGEPDSVAFAGRPDVNPHQPHDIHSPLTEEAKLVSSYNTHMGATQALNPDDMENILRRFHPNPEALPLKFDRKTGTELSPFRPANDSFENPFRPGQALYANSSKEGGAAAALANRNLDPLGKLQADRFSLGNHVGELQIDPADASYHGASKIITLRSPTGGVVGELAVDANGTVIDGAGMRETVGKPLSEVIGRDLSAQAMNAPIGSRIGGQDLHFGGEGMKTAYDQMYPKIISKELQRLDPSIKYGQTTLQGHEDKGPFHYFPLTDKAKEGIRSGLPLFSNADETGAGAGITLANGQRLPEYRGNATPPMPGENSGVGQLPSDIPRPNIGNYEKGVIRYETVPSAFENSLAQQRFGKAFDELSNRQINQIIDAELDAKPDQVTRQIAGHPSNDVFTQYRPDGSKRTFYSNADETGASAIASGALRKMQQEDIPAASAAKSPGEQLATTPIDPRDRHPMPSQSWAEFQKDPQRFIDYNEAIEAMNSPAKEGTTFHARQPLGPYALRSVEQRPFEADYPAGSQALNGLQSGDKLTRTIEDNPITAPYIAGRRVVGGPDEALSRAQVKDIGTKLTDAGYDPVSRLLPEYREDPNTLHQLGVNAQNAGGWSSLPPEVTGEARNVTGIHLNPALSKADKANTIAHEVGHAIDLNRTTGGIDRSGIDVGAANPVEAGDMYHRAIEGRKPSKSSAEDLARYPIERGWDMGYPASEMPSEINAQSLAYYMQNPNAFKAEFPDLAASIREHYNTDPALKNIVQFNANSDKSGVSAALSQSSKPSVGEFLDKTLPMDEASRMARAKAMGFDTDATWYHGSKSPIDAFDLDHAGKSDPGLVGKAAYFTSSREQAGDFATNRHYGSGDAPNVTPAYLAMKNPAQIVDGVLPDGRRLSEAHPNGIQNWSADELESALRGAGHDGAIFKTAEGEPTQAAVYDTSKIRSPQAAFDPDKAHMPGLLLSNGDSKSSLPFLSSKNKTPSEFLDSRIGEGSEPVRGYHGTRAGFDGPFIPSKSGSMGPGVYAAVDDPITGLKGAERGSGYAADTFGDFDKGSVHPLDINAKMATHDQYEDILDRLVSGGMKLSEAPAAAQKEAIIHLTNPPRER